MRSVPAVLIVALCSALIVACGGSVDVGSVQQVSRSERVWVDTSRETPRTAKYPGAPERTLRVLIWRLDGLQGAPLLLMAHGFGGRPEKFDAFARTLAAAGYVVAAPAFPLTNQDAPGGHDAGLRDFINQPADLSFVLTELLQATKTGADPLAGTINPAQVAVLGHSLGGTTVIGLTRKTCCLDARVSASILVAAAVPLATSFGSDAPDPGLPTLLIHGTADPIVTYSTSLAFYDHINAPRFLVGLRGAAHSEAVESQATPAIPARDAAQRASVAFLNAVFRNAEVAFDATLADLAADGHSVRTDPTSAP